MTDCAFTIDVEEWFHVENLSHLIPPSAWAQQESRLEKQMDHILDLMDEFNAQGTFFVLGAAVESRPQIVRSIVDRGHELACHGWSHELIYRQTPGEFRQETTRAKSFLEDASGVEVRGYRASTFSIVESTRWALDILAEAGFVYDSSIAPVRHDRYGIPDAPTEPHEIETKHGTILEAPITFGRFLRGRVPYGGGFLRLLPQWWLMSQLRPGAMTYLHPWEFDPDHPCPEGFGGLKKFRHRVGLRSVDAKVRALLGTGRFGTLDQLLSQRS